MCFDPDSHPPVPPMAGAAIDFRELELQAGDGNRFAAFGAFPEAESDVGVVILPDVRGLYQFYEELALRFAERGCAAVAIDYFGRTAGSEKRGADFEFRPHVEQTTFDGVQADTGAAVAFLRSAKGGSRKRIFTVGFCFGGAASWLAAASGHDLAGAVGFYGRPLLRRNGGPSPVDRAPDIKAPVLALMGGADEGIPVADVEEFRSALIAAAVEHEIRIYPGAPHSFFDRKFEEYADVSADAWGRTLEFIFGPGVPR